MNLNGIIVGVAVFLIIGICHPITIKMEYHWGKKSWAVFCAAGLLFTIASILVDGMVLSTILGAAAFSCFWGIREIISQEKRVLRGWFPENPARHEYYERRRAELNIKNMNMNKLTVITMAFSLFGLFSCGASVKNLDVKDFSGLVEDFTSVRLIDVRTPEEYSQGHLKGAANIDWYDSLFVDNVSAAYDKSAPLYIYCRSGKRASEAAAALDKAGFEVFNLKGGYLAWTEAGMPVTKYEVERFRTASGKPVDMTLIKHGTLEISYDGLSIQFDPVAEHGKTTDYATEFPKADYIFVTHEHGDHLDEAAITALTGDNTVLFLNGTSQGKIGKGEVLSNGDSRDLSKGVKVEAVPAYNTTPGRERFHPKGNGNGYVLTLDGFRIYIAGDTEDVPEMADLKDIDVALLPVNQPYTMTVDQCVSAALAFKPKVLIPYHFGQTDISSLPARLPGIDVRLRDMR